MLENVSNTKDRFKFNLPLEILKSDDKGWKVRGLASTEDRDLQGEIVRQNGLDISMLKAGRGLFNYEHKNDPENLVGLIEDAKIDDNGLEVEGYLFKKHKRAQALVEIMESLDKSHKDRVQLSIEGKIQQRDERNQKDIKRAMIDRVALTFEPVNQSTYLRFAKSLVSNEELPAEEELAKGFDPRELLMSDSVLGLIGKSDSSELKVEEKINEAIPVEAVEKTLTAGYGTADAPATRTQGAALMPESLGNGSKPAGKKKKKLKKEEVKKALFSLIEKLPEIPPAVLAKKFMKSYLRRFER